MKRKVRTRKLGIKFKILIPVCVCVLVVCVVMGINSYKHITDGMVEMGVQEADMAADLTLRMLDGDEVEQIVPGAEESDAYKGVLAALKNMKDSCGIAYLYTLYTDGTNVYYGVDVEATEDVSYLGDPFADSYEELKSVFEGQEYVQDYIDETEDGDLITVYKPITNSAGKVVAVLGCDYDASDITARLDASLVGVVKIGAVCIVMAVAALSIIISTITRGLQKVDDKIYEIVHNEGDLTQKLDIHSGDEMELIAGNVNALLEYIRGIMLKISDNSEHLNGSSQKIAQNLAAAEVNITDVSATMEEMSAAMEETNASLEQISTSVGQVYASIENMAARAEHGKESSGEMNVKCNLSEGIEVIHTGFYCFTHTGKELEFLYDTQSQILYFQGSNSNGYHFPLGVLFQSKCLPHIINYQGLVRMRFSLMLNNNSFFCYQGYDTIQQSFINKVVLYFPITTYTYFIFQKYEGYHAIKIKPMEIPSFTFKAGKFCF